MLKGFSFGRDKSPGGKNEETRSELIRFNVQREQLRVAVKETLRTHGIPGAWVGGELISATNDQEDMAFVLILQEWHEEILRYLPALQSHILMTLRSQDPSLTILEKNVSWQFSADSGVPHKTLPHNVEWGQLTGVEALHNARQGSMAEKAPPAGQTPPAKPKFDLPPSDLDRLQAADGDPIPSTFAATETGFLATQPAAIGSHKPDPKQ